MLAMKRSHAIAALLAAHLLPVAAWAMVKPLRAMAPQLMGLSCTPDGICTDDMARVAEARHLLTTSREFVAKELGAIHSMPRAVFCSTASCAAKFGLGRSAAFSVGKVAIVLSDRALFKPSWLIEGMAYARSQDPRQPLPEPLESWRTQYQQWERRQGGGPEALWSAAQRVPIDP